MAAQITTALGGFETSLETVIETTKSSSNLSSHLSFSPLKSLVPLSSVCPAR